MTLIKYEQGFWLHRKWRWSYAQNRNIKSKHYSMNHKSTSAKKRVVHKEDISLNKCTNLVSIAQSMTSRCQLQKMLGKAACTTSSAGGGKNRNGMYCDTVTQISSKPDGKTKLIDWRASTNQDTHSLWGEAVCAGCEYLWWLQAVLISWIIVLGKNNNTLFLMTFDI